MLEHRDLTERIIGLAIEVRRQTGPGLLDSVYAACMCFELEKAGVPLLVGIPVFYKGLRIPLGFRADILVAETVRSRRFRRSFPRMRRNCRPACA